MRLFTIVLVAITALATPAFSAAAPSIPYTEFRLDNGLRVILHEDHSTPIVGVNIWYHVGSKNEVPGKTGFAHLFEHMMFQGSKKWDDDYFIPIQEAGGAINGSTNVDRTNYWEVVPSNFLEMALFLEADRMNGLLEAMTEEKLANQRDVVKNEKRQNYLNRPYGIVTEHIAKTLYPPDHPYHWLTIGSLADLTAASMDDVKDFFRRFYTPNNASLAIAGDINPAQTRKLVETYFGSIPKGPEKKKVTPAAPRLEKETRLTVEDRVTLPRIYLTWHTAPMFSADEAALDTLADILGGGKTSRLYKSLVYEKQIAQDVNAFNFGREVGGTLQIIATAKPGKTLEELEKAIDAEVAAIRQSAPTTEEIERSYNDTESSFIYALQNVGGFGGKSDRLNQYATYRNNPGWLAQDLARYRGVKPADVQRVANQYLTSNRLVASVIPSSNPSRPAEAEPEVKKPATTAETKARPSTASLPKPKPDPSFKLPTIQRRKLANGLEVMIVEHHELPVVGMNLVVKNGAAAEAAAQAGLATLTADLVDEGTSRRSSLQIANELGDIGARLQTSASWDSSNVGLVTLTRHLDKALGIYADVITGATFPDKEIARLRQQRLTQLKQRRDDAQNVAVDVYARLIYGKDHPYGHPLLGDEKSIAALGADDFRKFYQTYYRPNASTLIVVGDVTPASILPKLEKAFASWKAGKVPSLKVASPAPREKTTVYVVDKPGAAQSVLAIGHLGVPRSTEDFFPLLVMNQLLGGQFTSRLNMNLRENKGYTYGARSIFDYRRGAGPFFATAGVQTAVTRESVFEFLKELRGIRGDMPITEAELNYAKQGLIRGFPRTFETPEQIAFRLGDLVLYDLPDNYFNSYIQKIAAVKKEDLERVARKYIDPSRMAVLVVGDVKVIEAGLRGLDDIGTTVQLLDLDGQQMPAPSGGSQ